MEKDIERKLVNRVRQAGGRCLKFVSPGTAGVPDRIVLLPGGRIVFVEVKDVGKKLRPVQAARIAELRSLGFDVRVIDSRELVDYFVKGEAGNAGL